MYLSHTVRRIREDPQPEESVGLVVELDDAGVADDEDPLADLREAVRDAGGRVGRDLGFGAHHVVVAQSAVGTLCTLERVVHIETDATISLDVEGGGEGPGGGGEPTAAELREQLEDGRNDT